MVLKSYIITSWWLQTTNWVRTIATGQLHNISFRITEVWNELNKSKVKNPPDLVLNSQIAYATLNRMVTTMKIAWSEAPMGNTRT